MNRKVAVLTKPTPAIDLLPDPRPGIPSPREMDENYFVRTLDKIEAWLKSNEPSPEFVRVLRRFGRQIVGPQQSVY